MPKITYRTVPVTDLTPYPGNARRGDLELLKDSLLVHGQYRPLVVQESTGYILAGNNTWLAMKELGLPNVDIGLIDVDEDQAKRILVMDNRANDLAGYDDQALADLLMELEGLEGTGFDQDSFDSLMASLGPGGFKRSEIEQVIKIPDDPVTQPGDVIALGPHVLHCADAFEFDVPGLTVDMVWTDPPYLISYQTDLTPEEAKQLHRRTDGKEIANEAVSAEQAYLFRDGVAKLIFSALKPSGVYYLHVPPGPDQAYWINALEAHKLKPRQVLQWVKDVFVFGRSDYHYRSEPILYGWREGGRHTWNGGRSKDSVFEFQRPKRSKDHPTMKPVELAQEYIENSSSPGDAVLDPFAGSGTSLVACMQTGRRWVGVEIDPGYCDVIVERYERLTGESVR